MIFPEQSMFIQLFMIFFLVIAVTKRPLLDRVLIQFTAVQILTTIFLKSIFNVLPPKSLLG